VTARIKLQPWNVSVARLGPAQLPPIDTLDRPPVPPSLEPHPDLPFENLVFEGGGAKAIAYVGAVSVLEEAGLFPTHVRRIAGTSSGSLLAALLAVGCTTAELEQLLLSTDLSAVMRDARFGWVSGIVNMIRMYGLHPGSRLLGFLGDRLAERTGSADVTFRQVLERCGRELCIPVTNLTRMQTEYCHPKTTPDMPVRLAVGMSMSLPVLMMPYRLIRTLGALREANLYTDGGLLCNYPVHAFDGWWLSLRPEDTFLTRLRPFDSIGERMHDQVRFQPRNPRTLGFTVFDRTEADASQRWALVEGRPPSRPETTLTRRREAREERVAERRRMATALDRAAVRLVEALAAVETDGDGQIDRTEIERLFDAGPLKGHDAELLFGTTDVGHIFGVMDANSDGRISYEEILRFVDGRNVDLTAHHGLARTEPSNVTGFLHAVVSTLLLHLRRMSLHPADRDRTVPIDTDYVSTSDFGLETPDRRFLLACGRRSTEAFLRVRRGARPS
jgi:arachidonate 5-lipoxygenase